MTERQYQCWQAWLHIQWNQPSRSDYYLMANSCEVRRVLSKSPNAIQPHQFQLKFETKEERDRPKMTVEQAAAFSKAAWLGRMTAPVQYQVGFHNPTNDPPADDQEATE